MVRSIPMPPASWRGNAARPSRVNRPLLIAIAIFFAVLIADAVIIAAAAPSVAELGLLYVSTT